MSNLDDLLQIPDEVVHTVTSEVARTAPEQEELLRRLRGAFRGEGITLVLGAGVSAAANVPPWVVLMSRLSVETLSGKLSVDRGQVAALAEAYGLALPENLLIRARYLRDQMERRTGTPEGSFIDAVRRELYANATAVQQVPLFRALGRLCNLARDTSAGVVEVLTYNFDRLMEEVLSDLGREFRSVDRGSFPPHNLLTIRHVHGSLARPGTDLSNEWLIFAEDQYHEAYSDPFSWSNIVQLNAFCERHCVFVGVSLDDPYTRRLLEAVKRRSNPSTPAHYAFMRCTNTEELWEKLPMRWSSSGRPADSDKTRVMDRLYMLTQIVDASKERALADLGVETLWFKRYEDLPALLDKIGTRD